MAACTGHIVALGRVFRLKMRRFYSKQWFIFSLLARDALKTSGARRDPGAEEEEEEEGSFS